MYYVQLLIFFFFLKDPPPPEIYPLPLHAALPISAGRRPIRRPPVPRSHPDVHARPDDRAERRGAVSLARPSLPLGAGVRPRVRSSSARSRSEEHTSELQSPCNLVCRLLLEKKKKK